MSVTARRKKASAQLEESEKAVESKRKALQQAQEDLDWRRRGRNMLRRKRHVQAWSRKSKRRRRTKTTSVCPTRTRTREGNPSSHFSQSAEIQEVRTAVSPISAALALLAKALHPGILEAGTQLQLQQPRTPESGVRVEETSSFGSAFERFALETPPRLPADSEEEKKRRW